MPTPNLDESPVDVWSALHSRLGALLYSGLEAKNFIDRLDQIADAVAALQQSRADDSLFVLVRMLSEPRLGYSASHALLSAFICQMVGPQAGLSAQEARSLVRAALSMNIAMARLHDQLASQIGAIDEAQRAAVMAHPGEGAKMLRALGVTDPLWLQLVQEHHETVDGKGYPAGTTELSQAQKLLHMADVFVAKISPRGNRKSQSPGVAAGTLFAEARRDSAMLGAIFVKQLGMYPPGTYVQLASLEMAVVVRRGEQVNTPLALALTDQQGLALARPLRRDTKDRQFRIRKAVAPDQVKIRLDPSRLLKDL